MVESAFDERYYRTRHGLGTEGTFAHFVAEGDRAGLDPCPYFSTRYYRTRYPDWQARGARTAVEDFLARVEAGDVRQPHPLIDPAYYVSRYPDLAHLGARAVLHFFALGDGEVRSPSAAFDAVFYQRCYLALEQRHPFRHFVTEGERVGLLPVPRPRSREASQEQIVRMMTGLVRPLLLCAHDAQPAGVPMLTLDLARAMAARGQQPVFVLNWAGPLVSRFHELGPVVIVAEGWNLEGLAAGLPAGTTVLINTAAAAGLALPLAGAGHRCTILLHEMGDYIRDQNLLPDIRAARDAGATLIASVPRMADGLKDDLGPLDAIRPGIMLPPTSLEAFRRVTRQMRGEGQPVFIGAGHADRRKGFDLFLEAASTLAERRPGARFVWLGALDSWSRGLADDALSRGLDLTLPGFVPDALAWYRAADVYLLTSRQDPGPTTAIHAAAVGTPFVAYASDIGLIGEADACGQFVPPDDVTGFVDAALTLAAGRSPRSRRALRRIVKRAASFDVYVQKLWERLMSPGAAAPTGGAAPADCR